MSERSTAELRQLTDLQLARGYLRAACVDGESGFGRLPERACTKEEAQSWQALAAAAEWALCGLHALLAPGEEPTYQEVCAGSL